MRPACLVVGCNWPGCFFVSSIFVRFLSYVLTSLGALYSMLGSSPCTRLGLVRAWMIGGRGNGKMSRLYESSASTTPAISTQNSLSLSAYVLSLITWRSPHDIFMRQENIEGNACPGTSFLDFSIELSERLVTISGWTPHLSSYAYFHSLHPPAHNSTLTFPCARNMIGIRSSLRCHYTATCYLWQFT